MGERGAPPPLGLVLAGGRSLRMGRDKTALMAGGETLAAYAARRLAAVCGQVVIADGGRRLVADFESVADGPEGGPAAGILGAARAWPGRPLLVLACDLPCIPVALLAELAREDDTTDWVVPRWSRGIEPLCALYRSAALGVLAAAAARGVVAPHRLGEAAALRIRYLEGADLTRFGAPGELFLNLNTPDDLARWLALAPRA
jgi:molybdopterin-guanine dinucleotide biosynthesis protein A